MRKDILLMLLVFPFLSVILTFDHALSWTTSNPLNYHLSQNDSELTELDQKQTSIEEKSNSFLREVNNRISSGEDPETLVDLFVYWDTRQPDFPEWVTVIHSFNLLPVIQVSCKLGDVSEVAELRHVTKVMEMGSGYRQALSSVDYLSDPYIGEYPLLLNETRSLVEADDTATTGSDVIIAILSTGINEAHPMLDDHDDDSDTNDPKILDSFDAYEYYNLAGTDETIDLSGWGTALASIVGGTDCCGGQFSSPITFSYPYPYKSTPYDYDTQTVTGFISVGSQLGMAPAASLFDVKITNDDGTSFTEGSAITGLEWAVEHGADIILMDIDNLSASDTTIIEAIEVATSLGALVVVPAGDYDPASGYDDDTIAPYYTINSPASAPSALTVGAITETEAMWLNSERGPVPLSELSKPDVVAPGVNMLAADYAYATNEGSNPGGWLGDTLYYDIYSSTVVAAAVAAGAGAHLIESYPGATPTAIKIALRQGANDLGYNEMAQGKGEINITQALDVLQAAAKISDNWVGSFFNQSYTPSQLSYQDFNGKRILFDGSYSTTTSTWYWYDWSGLVDGDLTTLGSASNWQHPYDDTANQYIWYNVSYPGAEQVYLTLNNITLATGDNFTIYRSVTPNEPIPTTMYGPSISNFTGSAGFIVSDTNFYFRWGSNGDGATTGHSVFGIYGSIQLRFRARDITLGKPAGGEFNQLADQLYALGADVDYWFPNSANAPPTATILEYYDVYVLPQPRAAEYGVSFFGQPNASAYYDYLSGNLNNYLDGGGNILFIGDLENNYYNNATRIFGVEWVEGGVGGPTSNFISHELTTTPFTIEELLIDAPLAYFSGTGTPIVYDGNVPTVVSHTPTGKGKAIFVADEDVFNDEMWSDPFTPGLYNNSQFALNIFYWFAGINYQSGPTTALEQLELVSYSFPKIMTDGDNWLADFVIQNTGNVTSQPLLAFGMDWTPTGWHILGGTFTVPGDDNANDTWGSAADGDIGVSLNDTSIEFFYNISTSYPVNQIGLPMIELATLGEDRSAGECRLYFNDVELAPIYEAIGNTYYAIAPDALLYQYNNRVNIDVPFEVNLTLTHFRLYGLNFSNSLGVQHIKGASLAPGENTTISFSFTPDVDTVDSFQPELVFMPTNLTHAWISPGFAGSPGFHWEYDLSVIYGAHHPGYYLESPVEIYGVNKRARRGDLPIIYDITPGALDSSTSPKIVQFPGDLRVDGLTIMTSTPIESPSLQVNGSIATIIGLGDYSQSVNGLGSYSSNTLAPNYFYINDSWSGTNLLALEAFNTILTGPILQTDIPLTQSPMDLSGYLNLYSDNTVLYSVKLEIKVVNPTGSFLLYDTTAVDVIDADRNYDKLWDQLFELWKIATENNFDVDSLYQETYRYSYRNHEVVSSEIFLDWYVCNVPIDEDLPYNGILGIGMDDSDLDPLDDFLQRGGSLIQFGSNNHLGPDFSDDIIYQDNSNTITTLIDGSDSTHPLMTDVDQLFYLGGGYIEVNQQDFDRVQNYDVLSGENWLSSNISHDLGVIYHDAIYPDRFGYDAGKYSPDGFDQAYKGVKIIIGTDVLALNWFLEQTDIWGYFSMKYAANLNLIPDHFTIDLDNHQFIENIFRTAANSAPEIDSVTVTPQHVEIGDDLTIRVRVSDDYTPTSDLIALIPEQLENDSYYVEMDYDSTSGEFVGTFRIKSTYLLNGGWDIYIFDEMYRLTGAVDPIKLYFTPELNIKPIAWISPSTIDSPPYSTITEVSRGDLYSLTFYYWDTEDSTAIDCNVTLVYYKNENDTEIVTWELFTGRGQGIFFVDTTELTSGTYLIVATVTDTDGGTASYELAGFNLEGGTLFKPKEDPGGGPDVGAIIGLGAVGTAIAGAAAGGIFFLRKKGISLRSLIGKGSSEE